MSPESRQFYHFGGFNIESQERLLRYRDEVVPLPPKAVELLLVLAGSEGRVLTKDELMTRVWPDSYVEESNLSQTIFLLRKAFKMGGEGGPQYIETVPRRGYRFVADVSLDDGSGRLTTVEHTRSSIVVEEEIIFDPGSHPNPYSPIGHARLQTRTSPWGQPILAAAGLLTIVAIAIGFLYYRAETRPASAAFSVRPVTSFPDNEYEPALSPDGQLVAFSWTGGVTDPEKMSFNIYVKQIVNGNTLQVTHNQGRSAFPAFSPDGQYLAYVRGPKGELMIVPALGGPERKLFEGLEVCMPTWTPDGRHIVFASRRDQKTPRQLSSINVETLELRHLTSPSAGSGDSYVSVSPDSTQIAFVRADGSINEVFVQNIIDGDDARQLTFDKRRIHGLTWTVDGSAIVFASNRNSGRYQLWRLPGAGGDPVPLPGVGDGALLPTISRRGNRLAFHRESSDTNIWRVAVNDPIDGPPGRTTVKVVSSSQRDEFPTISPDGSRLAFSSTRSGAREIWLSDIDGSRPRQLTQFGGGDVAHPRWSPDGRSITFDASPAERSMIFVCDVDSGLTRIAADDRGNSLVPSWSSDGSHIYFGASDGSGWDVWKVAAAGGPSARVTMSGGFEAHESPDGEYIYYNKDGYYTTGIFRQSVAGGPEVKVSDLPQLWSVGDWRLSGSGIYFIHRYKHPHVLDPVPAIKFLDFDSGKIIDVAQLEGDPGGDPGLSLSPDGKYLFYSRTESHTSDIMMIDNFQ